ncbi:MAG: MipA/OmpV family protein, partial [Halofilum sp. (in: g-proteobacteria)]|nr:MipA/OmpV family protein [Halofilum sp. (in: g-proteobacteria)]
MDDRSPGIAVALVLALCLAGMPAAAEDQPLWELGLGIGAGSFPEYRGSRERSSFVVPIPYLVYRGERLRADRDGIRGLLATTPNWELNLSFDGAVPVESSNEGPRAGMAELDPVIEYGPSLIRHLGRNRAGRWSFRLPLRAATAIDPESLETSHEGWTLQPSIHLDAPGLIGA